MAIAERVIDEVLASIAFNREGLVPVIAQQHDSGEVLMLAWMNREAVAETLATGRVCYWSRSRGKLWRKGESSGQVQRLVELRLDCDGDALLLQVEQTGVACHTGRRSCFFTALRDGRIETIAEVERIMHPAMPGDPGHALWRRDFSGACGLFGVALKPAPRAAIAAMVDGLELFGMGASWGGYESLVMVTKPNLFRSAAPWKGEGPTLRFHAGLEAVEDLVADLEAGFRRFNDAR